MNTVSEPLPIRLVIADVDGTLVTSQKELTPRALEAVRNLQRAGIAFTITSGRPPLGMKMLIDPLALAEPFTAFNGGMLVKPDLSIVRQNSLPDEVARKAMQMIAAHGLDVWLYRGDQWLVRDVKAPHVAREQWTVQFPPQVVPNLASQLNQVVKIVGVSDDYDLVARCEADMQQALGGAASAERSQPYYLDVTHPDANKGQVVKTLSEMLHVPRQQIATIGDMPNDVLMFKESGMSIAMGNAKPEVQQFAKYVTASNEEDGFAIAMEEFVLRSQKVQRAS
jgi:hypothetical protein